MPGIPETRRFAWTAWAGVVLLAGALRFVGLGACPPGIFRDEAEKGYNAWALAKSGSVVEFPVNEARRAAGERWRRFPLLIEVMGVKTSAVYQYASVPFVAAFGLGPASARMAAALAGTLAVAALGALLLALWPAPYALAAALWLALCPWHIIFSRWALEGIFVPLAMAGALAGLAAIQRERAWGGALLGASLGFAFYAYSGAQPFALAWGAALAALEIRRIRARPMILVSALAAFALLAAPRAWVMISEGGDRRLAAIAIWGADAGEAAPGAFQVLLQFIANYLAHLSPIFLFLRGDALPRHGIPGLGQLLLIDAFLLPLGAAVAWKRNLPLARPLVLAFLIGPVGAAITRVGIPHALRSLPMALPAATLAGVGLAAAVEWIASRPIPRARVYAALFALACAAYAGRVYGIYWQRIGTGEEAQIAFAAPERRAFEAIFKERRAGETVYIDGRLPYAPYFALFYGKLAPAKMREGGFPANGILFFNPEASSAEQRFGQLAPGDWLLELDPAGLPLLRRKPPAAP